MARENPRRAAAEAALTNPNVRQFLDMIMAAEGAGTHRYATAFGGARLESLADHPRQRHTFRQTDGKENTTTAAGAYQFLESTWDDVAGKLGLTDFGDRSQDLAAVELLRRAGALDAVLAGDWTTAVQKAGRTWASLPSSPYAQPRRSDDFIAERLPGYQPLAADRPPDPVAVPSVTPPSWAALLPPSPSPGPQPGPIRPLGPARVPGATTPDATGVPATAPNAVRELLAMMAPPPAPAPAPELSPEDEAELAAGLDVDVAQARGEALANFFGEQYVPEVQLPQPIEAIINRYLAQL